MWQWRELSLPVRLDVLLSEQIYCGDWAAVRSYTANVFSLLEALSRRGVIWDRQVLPKLTQHLYIETHTAHMRNDWHNSNVKRHAMKMILFDEYQSGMPQSD